MLPDGAYIISMVTYEIRHLYKKLERNEMEVVQSFQAEYDSAAMRRYEELIKEYPGHYFELRKITHEEKVIDFNPVSK